MEHIIRPPVQPDNPAAAFPSDHRIAFAKTKVCSIQPVRREAKVPETNNLDGKICSIAVKQASRRKNREYAKNGNSSKYKDLKKVVKAKLKEESSKCLKKQTNLVSSKNNSWLKHVKRIAACPGDQPTSSFYLPKHVEYNLSALESSYRICEFFSSISQEYSPLNVETLPEHVRLKLTNDPCSHPNLPDHEVYEGLKKRAR